MVLFLRWSSNCAASNLRCRQLPIDMSLTVLYAARCFCGVVQTEKRNVDMLFVRCVPPRRHRGNSTARRLLPELFPR